MASKWNEPNKWTNEVSLTQQHAVYTNTREHKNTVWTESHFFSRITAENKTYDDSFWIDF